VAEHWSNPPLLAPSVDDKRREEKADHECRAKRNNFLVPPCCRYERQEKQETKDQEKGVSSVGYGPDQEHHVTDC
jgi:hypothetical protein